MPDTAMSPKLSIIICAYNDSAFLAKKLAEIQRVKDFADFEFIFVETASPTRERELLEPFCREHPNCKLVATDERHTLYGAWNLGWEAATAPFVCYSNMDDAMHPELPRRVSAFMERRKVDAATVIIALQEEGDPMLDSFGYRHFRKLRLCRRPGPFTVWRRELDQRVGKFDPSLRIVGDKDFWSRIEARKCSTAVLPEWLYIHTLSPTQLSSSERSKAIMAEERTRLAQRDYPQSWPKRLCRELHHRRWIHRILPFLHWIKP